MSELDAGLLSTSSPAGPAPEAPVTAPSRRGTSAFAFLVGLWIFLLTAFFGASGVAMVMRWSRSSSTPEATQAPVVPPPPSFTSQTWPSSPQPARAIVTVPAIRKNGIVRAEPTVNSKAVNVIAGGEVVEVDDRRAVQEQTRVEVWFHIRGTVQGRPVSGWMHSDILRPVGQQ
ncbi:hypothetical protein BE20_41615 [Sorangium cellulosum]|uniref:Uncharacterized protein n=1 Tax=Sorangium cellulosum TaxID=56 RepID=A0A150RT03_SORCE|nr:hypothetical protein BE18_24880 [Sorangium cellulosum]KYF96602.1 hypothetical protein BE20_41615 [Sorangium cellulosum]